MNPAATLFAGCALLTACSLGGDRPKEITLGAASARTAPASSGAEAPAAAAAPDEPWQGDPQPPQGPQPFKMMVTRTVVTEAGAPPTKENPDDAILARARMAAGGCFSSLPAGGNAPPQRSAHIVFTVIPTGSVSTADVSSADTTDDRVIGCLRQQALSTTFSDNGGGPLRTYAIDVSVIARGSGGGR